MNPDFKNLEIHLLALRDAADAALLELERVKSETPQAATEQVNSVARHLAMLNNKSWGKPNKKTKK